MLVVAYFDSAQELDAGAREASRAGWRAITVCAPAYDETALAAAGVTRSPVGLSTLTGGVAGLVFGVLLTVGTVRQWPGLIVSGKPLVSVPPFLVIIFELTILFASLGAVASLLLASIRARRRSRVTADARTTDDRFSLLLESDREATIDDELLRRMHASGWRRV